ncbi:MAG: hypothetical protein JRJ62_04845 [Deltaproteobacteria bacterium]|nr:hypothetical protein [Deltaproteobacteria bacterium]
MKIILLIIICLALLACVPDSEEPAEEPVQEEQQEEQQKEPMPPVNDHPQGPNFPFPDEPVDAPLP